MEDKNTAVFGIYSIVAQAELAVDTLVNEGFSNADVSVLMSDKQGSKDFAHEKNTKAPEGTTTGAATGGAIGGSLGLLAGIGALAIPGVGPLIAAGPSWPLSPVSVSAERSAASWAVSSAWAFPNTRPNDTRDGSKKVACCCPLTAIRPSRSTARKRSSSKRARPMSPPLAKRRSLRRHPLGTPHDSSESPSCARGAPSSKVNW